LGRLIRNASAAMMPSKGRTMHFAAELNEGDYVVQASAIPRDNGYVAAVTVRRVKGVGSVPRMAYNNLALDAGQRWSKAADALLHAVGHAQHLIWDEPSQLAC
jgi:hypothetical protein